MAGVVSARVQAILFVVVRHNATKANATLPDSSRPEVLYGSVWWAVPARRAACAK